MLVITYYHERYTVRNVVPNIVIKSGDKELFVTAIHNRKANLN